MRICYERWISFFYFRADSISGEECLISDKFIFFFLIPLIRNIFSLIYSLAGMADFSIQKFRSEDKSGRRNTNEIENTYMLVHTIVVCEHLESFFTFFERRKSTTRLALLSQSLDCFVFFSR